VSPWGPRSSTWLSSLLAAAGLALAGSAAAAPTRTEVSFAVKGDWGAATPAQHAVSRRMCREHESNPFAFVLTTGDNFYLPDGIATDRNFYRPEACLQKAGLRWRAAWGNHDVRGPSTGTVLEAARFYSFAQGPLRVVVLDANRPDDNEQLRFLRRTLRGASEPAVVVAFHQPMYTAGFHGPNLTARRLWEPIFKRSGVTLVLQGHNHHYEQIVRAGITYVTTGGGGQTLYPCVRREAGLKRCVPAHHFLRVTATKTEIEVTAIEPTGKTLASFGLKVRA
jgi:tartrate-resistant acid phosphatase type 5